MAKVEIIERQFEYNGVKLPDPGTSLSLEQVKAHYANTYPDILNSTFKPQEVKKDASGKSIQVFQIKTSLGTKG